MGIDKCKRLKCYWSQEKCSMIKHAGTTQLIPLEYLVKCGLTSSKANWATYITCIWLHVIYVAQSNPNSLLKISMYIRTIIHWLLAWADLPWTESRGTVAIFRLTYAQQAIYATVQWHTAYSALSAKKLLKEGEFSVSQITKFCCNYNWNLTCTPATVYGWIDKYVCEVK